MGTLKFHLLDHIGDDIRRMGGLHVGDAGIYEHSHVHFKQHYRGTSRRRRSAMDETISAIDVGTAIRHINRQGGHTSTKVVRNPGKTRMDSLENEGDTLV